MVELKASPIPIKAPIKRKNIKYEKYVINF
jgi:hypothetical protein